MIDDTPTLVHKTNFKKRFFASLIDYALIFGLTYIYIDNFGTANEEGVKTVTNLMVLPIPIVWTIYFVVIESIYGGTLCHLAFNLKVLNIDRREIDFMQSLKRHLVDPIDFYILGLPAIIAIRKSDKHQRLGDMWANTVVIDITDPEQYETTTSNTKY